MTPTGWDRDVWEGRKPTFDSRLGSHTIGTVALATIGTSVWTDPERRRSRHDEPLGGIVLHIEDQAYVDENGECRSKRAFRTFDPLAPWDVAFRTYSDDLIAQDGVEATAAGTLVHSIRRFCKEVGAGRGGVLTSTDAQLITDAFHLAATLIGDHHHG